MNLIEIAASLAARDQIQSIIELCERQQTVRTSVLAEMVDVAGDRLARLAVKIRQEHDVFINALTVRNRECAELRRQLEQAGQRGDAVVWQVRNGLVTHGFYRTEKEASKVRLDMQKAHDLGGSLAAFNLRPLYAAPVPPAQPADTVQVPRNDLLNLVSVATLKTEHLFTGQCPYLGDHEARDDECPACQAIMNLERLLAGDKQ